MPETFQTPAGSPVKGFNDQLRSFTHATVVPDGAGRKVFQTPAGSPVVGYAGQIRVH
jgi:hypothetical protein